MDTLIKDKQSKLEGALLDMDAGKIAPAEMLQ
jgi:hypothetical protein